MTSARPAWVCDSPPCRYTHLVRAADRDRIARAQRLEAESSDVIASARRQMMRGRTRRDRADDAVRRSAVSLAHSAPRAAQMIESRIGELTARIRQLQQVTQSLTAAQADELSRIRAERESLLTRSRLLRDLY
jgi:hypothetical protein